jgi:acyl carrier protein
MERDTIRATVLASLADLSPEVDPATLHPGIDLRRALDLDRIDYLNFLLGIYRRTGIDVLECDDGRISTIDACVEFLASRLDEFDAKKVRSRSVVERGAIMSLSRPGTTRTPRSWVRTVLLALVL